MTKAIQILSKNLTGKENILIKETKSKAIKILDSYLFSQNIKNVNFNKISSSDDVHARETNNCHWSSLQLLWNH